MRFVLVCFLAVRAAAQIVEPNELSYGPFEPGPREHSFSIAVAPHGMLLAWSEVDQETRRATIHTGLLNFDAQLIGPINKLPESRTFMHATTPAVAADDQSFFVAWVDRNRYAYTAERVSGLQTDSLGRAVEVPRVLSSSQIGTTPALMWDGTRYRVDEEGERRIHFATSQVYGWVDWFPVVPAMFCPACPPPLMFTEAGYRIDWAIVSRDWIRSSRFVDTGFTGVAPAVVAQENDLSIVWTTPRGLAGMRVIDGVASKPFRADLAVDPKTSPAMAGSLVVFENRGDIYGSLIDGDAFGTPFPISTGPDDDTLPKVYEVGSGRYLVAYVREHHPNWVSLAGRFVTISP